MSGNEAVSAINVKVVVGFDVERIPCADLCNPLHSAMAAIKITSSVKKQ